MLGKWPWEWALGMEDEGMKPMGGRPGTGMEERPPGADDEDGSGGPDRPAAGMEGPGGGKAGGGALCMGCGWKGWKGWKGW